jgi:hypothetical protein
MLAGALQAGCARRNRKKFDAVPQAPLHHIPARERRSIGDSSAGAVEFLATDAIPHPRGLQRAFGINHGLGTDQSDPDLGIVLLQQFGNLAIGREVFVYNFPF